MRSRTANAARVQRPDLPVAIAADAGGRSPTGLRVFDRWNETEELLLDIERLLAERVAPSPRRRRPEGRDGRMSEAGAQFDPRVALPLPHAVEHRRPRIVEPADRLARLHAYFVEGCGEDVRPALESVLSARARRPRRLRRRRGRRRPRVGLVRGVGRRRARGRARARRGGHPRCRRGGRRGVCAPAPGGALRPLPRDRRQRAAARAAAAPRARDPAQPPARARRPRGRIRLAPDDEGDRVHPLARKRRGADAARARRGEGASCDAARGSRCSAGPSSAPPA